ncbi:MAG: glycoside hydrolase TIM-barrel-like domain-containing protein [Alphaproteobacteria bacterium]
MASIILSAAGSAAGTATGIPFANVIGSQIGRTIGGVIDNKLFGASGKHTHRNGPRLADLGVQTSTYGNMIPIVYGTVRIGGNIIWSRPIKELATTTTTSSSAGGGKGGGGKVTQSSTTYSYSITLAVGICEGPVDEVLRIWADAMQLDLSQYTLRVYHGNEEQLPDSLIQAFDGADNTPAYRGLSYVVFEDFPLEDFGNRIPNFTFEVQKKAQYPDFDGELLEETIKGITLIPGAGEFVYDTQVEYKIPGGNFGAGWQQQGEQAAINMHNPHGTANANLSLDQLERTCPNVEWVSVVVSWFGDSLDAGDCIIKPGVEYQTGAITSPDTWQVGSYTRSTARQITLVSGSPQYGGTPDDNSVLRLLNDLRTRGYNIMFYPMVFMDVSGKPWRGDITGTATEVADFFTKTNGYNAFINHYANLVDGKVEAFVIGSELKGLTKVTDTPGSYPAVDELVSLASDVKTTLGSSVKVTYAADWSEYHHTDGGWYNLDTLWASADIDVVGIDAYFPLSDAPQGKYDIQAVMDGWTEGEGYDFYYSDPARTIQVPLSAPYAWKNLAWFWENTHTNPDLSTTSWVPESKPIWFTEYGFPSVDGATNQPNVFFDPNSVSSALPYYSKGRVDFRAQRTGLMATEMKWQGSAMVERMFIWTWDARPYPYWPDLTSIWSDGAAWKTGHWVQGKLGISSLAAILVDLCKRSGLVEGDLNVSQVTDQVEGYVINNQLTIRNAIEILQQGYFFDTVESDGILKFISRAGAVSAEIPEADIVPDDNGDASGLLNISRTQEIDLPKRVNVVYINRLYNYQNATQYSQREMTESRQILTLDMPIVFADQVAKTIADVTLFTEWISRTQYEFALPAKYMDIEPADILAVTVSGVTHRMRVTSVQILSHGLIRVSAVADDVSTYDFHTSPGQGSMQTTGNNTIPSTHLEILDIPAFPGNDTDKGIIRYAGAGVSAGWNGAAVYRSDDGGGSYNRVMDIVAPAVIGSAQNVLAAGTYHVFDDENMVTVSLLGSGELQSVTELAVLNGANAALLGSEIIQFKTATLIEPNKYTLSGLLRGRLGTEWAVGTHAISERFVLLNGSLASQSVPSSLIGLSRSYKSVTFGSTLSSAVAEDFTYGGVALKPYAPVHVTGSRDGSSNLTISWVRRTRLGGHWQDGVDVPLSETAEGYEVDIINGSNVVRTITTNTPSVVYSAAQQTTDFGSPQASVIVRVYQMSALVGRGYKAEVSV